MSSPVLEVLPLSIREMLESLPHSVRGRLEEVRIREGRPLEVITPDRSWFLGPSGLVQGSERAYFPDREDCAKMLNLISHHSLYALEEELRRGYVTIEGGHRIGLVGRAVVEGGQVRRLRSVSGFNLRIAREVRGVAGGVIPYLHHRGRLFNTLIVSPPQCGKTTLLRDLVRVVSEGERDLPSHKVGVVDERSEIAGCVEGVPQHDIGPRTDVLDACPKAEGMMMMIRSMSPDLLVVDEIGRHEDGEAVFEAMHAGVRLFTTAHGRSLEEVCRRPTLSRLIRESAFDRLVLLSRKKGPGTLEGIYDESLQPLPGKEQRVKVR
ncbi:stage III sporulation protein AA [Desmospora profundinema]|uniref:Stage III sporulation protein AA n=1 Tax=Desmospora profundinema TaxID=1571184 RepID=A0ABU1IJE9_9BACL|nr:stage III sporulation protein AA [Desmospora profundinema]MDR6224662.1 stage III sporulation protein AA [Desmospora profundinema]